MFLEIDTYPLNQSQLKQWQLGWREVCFSPATVLRDTFRGYSGQEPIFPMVLLWRHCVYRAWLGSLEGALAGCEGQASEVGQHGGGLESDF